MSRLQQNLLKRQQPTTSSTPAEHPMKAPAEPLAMEEDVEMEREMLSIHNSDLQVQSYAMPVAAAALPTPLTQDSIEKIVQGILEMQQQRPEQKMRQTKPCLACGQPKSRYGTDGSSIHFFYQQGPVRYFYCSRKVHQTYAAEGLSDPRMPFEQFAASEFFQRELEATKKRVEEKARRQRPDSQPPDRLCRFCHLTLKQGPNSPHIHTRFPGVACKHIYCPSKVYSLYRDKGMAREMTWKEFVATPFFEAERRRWMKERTK
ncbi:hypothetical protein D4764_10G0009320 [Takifugu flavidus]|uniref:Uncharacterized protein n=2 Tax=Takifugu flavidus TaxID=433684 RepID=A0A5C6PJ93_9TELE|nr:hypothetical protein D4764_10G0009320 [Takifugu flavidus]